MCRTAYGYEIGDHGDVGAKGGAIDRARTLAAVAAGEDLDDTGPPLHSCHETYVSTR